MVSDLNIFAQNGLKSRGGKSFLRIFSLCSIHLKRLFAPIFQSPISKHLRFSESLGKNLWKIWSQIWILSLINDVKLKRKKNWIFDKFCLTSRIFWYRGYYPHRSRDALSPICGIFPAHYGHVNDLYDHCWNGKNGQW